MTISDLRQLSTKHKRTLIGLSFMLFAFLTLTTNLYQAQSQNAEAAAYDPGWIKCGSTASCTAVPGSCGEWMPSNIESAAMVAAYYQRLSAKIRCVKTIDRPAMPDVLCAQEKCTFGVKPAE